MKSTGQLVSIIICTRNRASSLRATLEAMSHVQVPNELHAELVVVDNGSSDDTDEVIRSARVSHMRVVGAKAEPAGQCHARNQGLIESAGDVIVFTDDDVRPSATWLSAMTLPIIHGHADVLGGDVILAEHLQRSWMTPMHRGMLAESLHVEPTAIVGANMSFGRHVLAEVPGFDLELGPGALGLADDSLFNKQLIEAGFRIQRAGPDSRIEHHFDEARLAPRAIANSAHKFGRSLAYLDHHWEHKHCDRPLLGSLKSAAGLCIAKSRAVGQHAIGCEEIHQIIRIAYQRQMMVERRRPRNYERHGLIKLQGLLDRRLERSVPV